MWVTGDHGVYNDRDDREFLNKNQGKSRRIKCVNKYVIQRPVAGYESKNP